MKLSARNQLRGRVVSLKLGTVMAEVTLDVGGGNRIVAAITRASAESLGLREGEEATALIKATEVLVGR
jgi:molybdopterin-binding protein